MSGKRNPYERGLPRPPAAGLPPAVAVHRTSRSDAYKAIAFWMVLATALFAVFALADGRRPAYGLVELASIAACGLIGAASLRAYVCVGPGWLSYRTLYGSTWVRTDQLVELTSRYDGLQAHLTLRDAHGRIASVSGGYLAQDPRVLTRLHTDVQKAVAAGAPLDSRTVELLSPKANQHLRAKDKGR